MYDARRLLGFLILLLIIFYFIVNNAFVQSYLVEKSIKYLQDKLKTEVRIGNAKIDILNRVVLQDVYLEDQLQDTILTASKIKLNFNLSPFKLLMGIYEIDEVSLEDVYFRMQRKEGQEHYNLQFILDAFKTEAKVDQADKQINFNISDIYLSRVHFIKLTEVGGQKIDAFVEDGVVHVNKLDLDRKIIDIRSIDLRRPYFYLSEYTSKPMASKPVAAQTKRPTVDDTTQLQVLVQNLHLKDGQFKFNDYNRSPVKLTTADEIDYKHLDIGRIQIDIDNFSFTDQNYSGKINNLALLNSTGFAINSLKSEEVIVNRKNVLLNNCKLVTPDSEIGDTIALKYRSFYDFLEFNDQVIMNGKFKNSKVAVRDILEFAPNLKTVSLFQSNVDKVFLLNGNLLGKVNNLGGKQIKLSILNHDFRLAGDFNSRNFANRDQEVLNLKLDNIQTSSSFLQSIMPELKSSKSFSKLGKISLSGRFDGFFADFVAQSNIKTDLGLAYLDVRMDLLKGTKNAKYSGNVELNNFELGKFINDQKIGRLSSKLKISEGMGLFTANGVSNLSGVVSKFEYNNFAYENINVNGQLKKNLFIGKFDIENDIANVIFDGQIDFEQKIPKMDFIADIKKLDLNKTKFTTDNLEIAARLKVNMTGDRFSNFNGKFDVRSLTLVDKTRAETYRLDSLVFQSVLGANDQIKSINIQSDLLSANAVGDFNPDKLLNSLKIILHKNYPGFYDRLKLADPDTAQYVDQFMDYQIELKDSKNFMKLLKLNIDSITNFKMTGYFDASKETFLANVDLEKIKYDNILFDDCALKFSNKETLSDALFILRHLQVGGLDFAPIFTNFYFERDSINFAVNSANFNSLLDNLNLNGKVYLVDSISYVANFSSSDLRILENNWEIKEGNFIKFNKNNLDIHNFLLTYLDRSISLSSINQGRGIELDLKHLKMHYLDELWKYDELEFGGDYQLNLSIKDIYDLNQLSLTAQMDTLLINNRNFGKLQLAAKMKNLSQPIFANFHIDNSDEEYLSATGYYFPLTKAARNNPLNRYEPDSYKADIKINNYPLAILEYFIANGINQTKGKVSGDLSFTGFTKGKPNLLGKAKIDKAETIITYLNTKYTIDNQYVTINNTIIDASGAILKDTLGNSAKIFGGIYHDQLSNFRLGVNLQSAKIIALNTTKRENPQYYGYGIGQIDATFSGPFNKTDIGIVANASKGTRLYIPIGSNIDASNTNYIRFKPKPSIFDTDATNAKKQKSNELKGLSLDMEISVDTDSEVQLLIDEQKGDIIKGRGRGNIQLTIPRGDKLSMYGNYYIEYGDYLFTLYNFINKPFNIKKGGSIQWTGDPFEAQINIEADYKSISTAPYNLISNYLEQNAVTDAINDSKRSTAVELILNLKGKLLKPDIVFDIKLPNLPPGTVKTYVDQQLNLIHQDQNELNRQVFGLIVAGTFLPSSTQNFNAVASVTNTGFNTVSEMISNQLSNLISEVLSGTISENSFVSGIDFNMKYIYDTGVFRNSNTIGSASGEIELRPKINLFNDKLSLNYGYVRGNNNLSNSGIYNNHDISADLQLTTDNKLKLRVYFRADQNLNGTPRNRAGIGFTFREEFDKFGKRKNSKETNN